MMRISQKHWQVSIVLVMAIIAVTLFSPTHDQATAQPTFTVNNLSDSGAGSLRQAILDANAVPGHDTITFSVTGTITLNSTLPEVSGELTISGPGAASLAISGADSIHPLTIAYGAIVTIDAITIQNGRDSGIENGGTLTVTNSTFSGNSAVSVHLFGGGGIANWGTLTITNCTFSGNSTSLQGGGGIYTSGGTATVSGSTFSNNSASGGVGGGIYTNWSTVTVSGSTFSNNSASGGGGGIFISNGTAAVSGSHFSQNSGGFFSGGGILKYNGTLSVTNCTFSGNSASVGGGSIFNYHDTMTVTNSTFSRNWAGHGNEINNSGVLTVTHCTFAGDSASGAAIFNSGSAYLAGSLLANIAGGPNCYGTITDNGYNLSEDISCGFSSPGSVNNVWLNLDELTTGGPGQQVHIPAAPSPAIDAIPNGTTVNNNGVMLACNGSTTDQLGQTRPINVGDDCTSGAVEVGLPIYDFDEPVTAPVFVTVWQPVPLCADFDGSTSEIIRADVPGGTVTDGSVFCRIQVENTSFVRPSAEVGQLGVLNRGVIQAVDVFALQHDGRSTVAFNNPISVCLQGSGAFLYLDASASPRRIVELPVTTQSGYTCATVPHAGTVVLVNGAPNLVNRAPNAVAPTGPTTALNGCMVTTRYMLNLRETPDANGAILRMIPYDVTLTALERTGAWFFVDYLGQRGWISAGYVTLEGNCGP